MSPEEELIAAAFLIFLTMEGCEIPRADVVGLKFRIIDGDWYAIVTSRSPFGNTESYHAFDFAKWVAFNGGS